MGGGGGADGEGGHSAGGRGGRGGAGAASNWGLPLRWRGVLRRLLGPEPGQRPVRRCCPAHRSPGPRRRRPLVPPRRPRRRPRQRRVLRDRARGRVGWRCCGRLQSRCFRPLGAARRPARRRPLPCRHGLTCPAGQGRLGWDWSIPSTGSAK